MKVYIDLDNILLDWSQGFINYLKVQGINSIPEDNTYYEYVSHKFETRMMKFYRDPCAYSMGCIQPFDGAKEFLSDVVELFGQYNVSIITHTYDSDECRESKERYIRNYFGFGIVSCGSYRPEFIIHTKDKYKETKDGILIEDNYKMIMQHSMINNAPSLMFSYNEKYPYVKNAYELIKGFPKVSYHTTYDSMVDKLKELKGDTNE
jgi:5'(3')-deoxyribonucleotidase